MKAQSDLPRPPHDILVIEDEPEMRNLLTDNLEFEGYRVTAVDNAEAGLVELARQPRSLIMLDLMLPRMSGFEFCREVRARQIGTPIIVLTARAEESDRIVGLDLGADDYMTKPFSVRELLARVRAQLRRDERQWESGVFVFGEVRVNLRTRVVTRRGQRLELSTREFELLRYLLAHRGEVVGREQLLRDVWGYTHLTVTRTVDNFIAKLRAHIEPKPHEPRVIITVHGSGYQMLV
jgi:two-component system alkaline phosphatase synthesis response regulator PhoP